MNFFGPMMGVAAALSVVQGAAAYGAGKSAAWQARRIAGVEADVLEQRAGQTAAAGQRRTYEIGRQFDQFLGTYVTREAASGAIDPTGKGRARIGAYGQYAQDVSRHDYKQAAEDLEYEALLTRYRGSAQSDALRAKAKADLVSGIAGAAGIGAQYYGATYQPEGTSLFQKYSGYNDRRHVKGSGMHPALRYT